MKRQQKKDLYKTHLFDLKKSLEWCSTVLGTSPSKTIPNVRRNNKLMFDMFEEDEDGMLSLVKELSYGAYDCENNTIYVNVNVHLDVCSLARTFIHEYVHYLQEVCQENETTWNPKYKMKKVFTEDGMLIIDSIIENEAEYNARKYYAKLLTHLGYDYTYSRYTS